MTKNKLSLLFLPLICNVALGQSLHVIEPPNGAIITIRGISGDGNFVAGSHSGDGFRFSVATGFETVPKLNSNSVSNAFAVANTGTVVGQYDELPPQGPPFEDRFGFFFASGSEQIVNASEDHRLVDISNNGVTSIGEPTVSGAGIVYSTNGQISVLSEGQAVAISGNGNVVAGTKISGFDRAVIWRRSGEAWLFENLGTLPGGNFSQAFVISADGKTVVGRSSINSGNTVLEAFKWTEESGMTSLGTFMGSPIFAEGISGDGSVTISPDLVHTDRIGLTPAENFLTMNLGIDFTGWTNLILRDVSDNGRIYTGRGVAPDGVTKGFLASAESLPISWGSGLSGNWDDAANWTSGLKAGAAGQDDVTISGLTNLVVTGPALAQNTSSLAVSGGINHQVELELVSDFTSDNDILIDEGGRIRLGGNLLMAGGNLMINVGGEITGYGLVDGPISGSLGLDGIDGSGNLYSHVGEFDATDFTANEVTVLSAGFSDLGTFIKVGDTANFGMINAPNGIFLNGASQLFGSGQVNGKVAATLGSQIIATDGDLILGDLDSFAGFFSAGEIYTNEFIVSIQDRNEAGLGTYTELGSSSLQLPGTLDITNGAVCDFGSVLAGWGTVESINNLDEAIVINGDVVGNSTSEPITFSGYVKGVGSFQNTNFDGTFAPGLSPGLVFGSNVAFGGDAVIEMEIGGPTAGIQHDKLVDVGSLTLGGMLRVQLINGYEPVSGDSFD